MNAARVCSAGVLTFLVLLALLHFLKPELDPSWRMISEYEIGEYGWVMTLAFLALSVSYAALFAALLPRGGGKFGPEVAIGWPNRFLIVTYAIWLITVARQLIRLRRDEA